MSTVEQTFHKRKFLIGQKAHKKIISHQENKVKITARLQTFKIAKINKTNNTKNWQKREGTEILITFWQKEKLHNQLR